MSSLHEPIDAVVTWFDGHDPRHQQQLAAALASLGRPPPPAAAATRFANDGELDWCLASIIRFAPWLRRVYIVTAAQRPPLLDLLPGTPWAERVHVIDHHAIFVGHEQYLPTFNSRSVISQLWRIPDLAERFVFFNDDFFLLREMVPDDFFRDGQVVLRGRWKSHARFAAMARLVAAIGVHRHAAKNPSQRRAQVLSAALAGYQDRHVRLRHCPYSLRRSTLADYFAAHPEVHVECLRYPFRDPHQAKAESLAAHLELQRGQALFDSQKRLVHLKPDEQAAWRLAAKLRRADRDPRAAFACVQSLDRAGPATRQRIIAWLNRRIGSLQAALAACH